MEFLDEYESRPRLLFQSKQLPQPSDSDESQPSSIHKPTLFISLPISILVLYLAFVYFDFEPLKSLLLWLSFSLFLGPFAPNSITAGDIRIGLGPDLKKETHKVQNETNEKFNRKTTKPLRKPAEEPVRFDGFLEKSISVDGSIVDLDENEKNGFGSSIEEKCEESEWSGVDEELLRKLMGKHPVGKPGRWEAIAEGLKGKHKVGSVVKKAKEIGERKVSDQDAYKKFLKDRKPVDNRVADEAGDEINTGNDVKNLSVQTERNESGWSAGDDLALLNALKAFPKDMAMRWEKITASLPGKTKSACMKRVAELKKNFRSSKAAPVQDS